MLFVITTENHARMFLPLALSRPKDCGYYITHLSRARAIKQVIRKLDPKNVIKNYNFNNLFKDILTTNNIYIFPLNHRHSHYSQGPQYRNFMLTPLDQLASTVVSMSQGYWLPKEQEQSPRVHINITRSLYEFKLCGGNVNTWNYQVGEPGLDYKGYKPQFKPTSQWKAVGMFTTQDITPTHKPNIRKRKELLPLMLKDLVLMKKKVPTVEKLILNDHPGSSKADLFYHKDVKKVCKKINIKCTIMPRGACDPSALAQHMQAALVQGTFPTHIALRKEGVQSFLYISPLESTHQGRAFKNINMPMETHYSHWTQGQFSPSKYDKYIRSLFLLDGHVADRFFDAVYSRQKE